MKEKVHVNHKLLFVMLFILVIVSRIPFLQSGYGIDSDAWSVANASGYISQTHLYQASRSPGFPIHEILTSFFVQLGPVGVNGATAVVGAMGVLASYYFFILTRTRYPLLFAITIAFTPIIYVASTMAIDYMWGYTFVFMCLVLLYHRKFVLSGILLGLAIGCRISSILFIIPATLFLWKTKAGLPSIRNFLSLTSFVAFLSYLPVYLTYGMQMFAKFPTISKGFFHVLMISSIGVWGTFGVLGWIVSGIFLIISALNRKIEIDMETGLSLTTIILYLLLFLRLPFESGYLIPIIPFTLLIMDRWIPNRAVVVGLCCSIVLSSFVGFNLQGISQGRIIEDHQEREIRLRFVETVLQRASELSPSVIVAGDWRPMIVNRIFSKVDNVKFVYGLSASAAQEILDQEGSVLYLPGQRYLILSIDDRIQPMFFDSWGETRKYIQRP